jgi:hypothetical protein
MLEPLSVDQTLLKKKKSKKPTSSSSSSSSSSDNDKAVDNEHRQELRRLKNLRKQADKVVEHFKALGLDEFGQPIDSVAAIKFPVRERQFTLPGSQEKIAINPVVTFIGGILPWLCIFAGIRTYGNHPLLWGALPAVFVRLTRALATRL